MKISAYIEKIFDIKINRDIADMIHNNALIKDFPIDPFRVIGTAKKTRLEEPILRTFWNLINRKTYALDP